MILMLGLTGWPSASVSSMSASMSSGKLRERLSCSSPIVLELSTTITRSIWSHVPLVWQNGVPSVSQSNASSKENPSSSLVAMVDDELVVLVVLVVSPSSMGGTSGPHAAIATAPMHHAPTAHPKLPSSSFLILTLPHDRHA